jgi:hypothetical protein
LTAVLDSIRKRYGSDIDAFFRDAKKQIAERVGGAR